MLLLFYIYSYPFGSLNSKNSSVLSVNCVPRFELPMNSLTHEFLWGRSCELIARMQTLSVGSVEMYLNLIFALHCIPSCPTVWQVNSVYQLGFILSHQVLPAREFSSWPRVSNMATPGSSAVTSPTELTDSAQVPGLALDSDFFIHFVLVREKSKNCFTVYF